MTSIFFVETKMATGYIRGTDEKQSVTIMDPRWKHPFSAVISGPSMSGKTEFVKTFINYINEMCDTQIEDIYWHYGACKPTNIKKAVCFKPGFPDTEDLQDSTLPKLLVIDDMMSHNDPKLADLFTKGCHHYNISVFYITQNIFHQGKGKRDVSLNAHYMVCFKNPRDKAQIRHLAYQVCPENPLFLQEAYTDATSEPHGYLLLDLKQDTPDEYRFRTNIFPSDSVNYVYVSRK